MRISSEASQNDLLHVRGSVYRVLNSTFSSNTYIYKIENTNECFVIDPGLDFDKISDSLDRLDLRPIAVLCTHGHFDHIGTSQNLKEKFSIPIYLHKLDEKIAKTANFILMACKIDKKIKPPNIDQYVAEMNSFFEVGGIKIEYMLVPGHTRGSCFIKIGDQDMFTGDSLYKSTVGLVDFPGEDKEELKASLLKIWDQIDGQTWIYPGHGGSESFSYIKNNNKSLLEFLGII